LFDSIENIVINQLPPSNERAPLFIIGDVHGCSSELAELVDLARQEVPNCQIILVGDLFTKGPDPIGVFDLIKKYKMICIKGNHDWALASLIAQSHKKPFHSFPEHTRQTLTFIKFQRRTILEFINSLPHALVTDIIPQSIHPKWEEKYPAIIVHAGIDPKNGLKGSTEKVLLTARYVKWDENKAKLIAVPGAYRQEILAASKSTPQPPSKDDGRFRWHELHQGPELIIFGHDAKQGLFRKTLESGRPICVGLDTGCTYGHGLTGYFPELDKALQVRSKRLYFDIRRNAILTKA
jgi:hypothetical protein